MIITDYDAETQYEPWIGEHHEMGYKVTSPTGRISYIYLNPSGGSSDGVPTVFVYQGLSGDSAEDGTECFILTDIEKELGKCITKTRCMTRPAP